MTESQYTSRDVKFLKDNGVVAFKHSDRFTTGIPDATATCVGRTTWLEYKALTLKESFYARTQEDKVQFFNMVALEAANIGKVFYIMVKGRYSHVFKPSELLNRQELAMPMLQFPVGETIHILKLVRGHYDQCV